MSLEGPYGEVIAADRPERAHAVIAKKAQPGMQTATSCHLRVVINQLRVTSSWKTAELKQQLVTACAYVQQDPAP